MNIAHTQTHHMNICLNICIWFTLLLSSVLLLYVIMETWFEWGCSSLVWVATWEGKVLFHLKLYRNSRQELEAETNRGSCFLACMKSLSQLAAFLTHARPTWIRTVTTPNQGLKSPAPINSQENVPQTILSEAFLQLRFPPVWIKLTTQNTLYTMSLTPSVLVR